MSRYKVHHPDCPYTDSGLQPQFCKKCKRLYKKDRKAKKKKDKQLKRSAEKYFPDVEWELE